MRRAVEEWGWCRVITCKDVDEGEFVASLEYWVPSYVCGAQGTGWAYRELVDYRKFAKQMSQEHIEWNGVEVNMVGLVYTAVVATTVEVS